MGLTAENIDVIVCAAGAVMGSIKASLEFDRNKHWVPRLLDIALGVFCGVTLAWHFFNPAAPMLGGMLALVGGVSGAVVIEVFMQMLPNIAKKAIKNIVDKHIK